MSNNRKPIYNEEQVEKLASHIKSIIELLGEDPTREGLVKTPQRAAKALIDNTSGYNTNPAQLIKQALFTHHDDNDDCKCRNDSQATSATSLATI